MTRHRKPKIVMGAANVLCDVPRRFYFDRQEDATGISGTGIVAHGVVFEDGTVCIRWVTRHRSTAVYASLADVEAIHGHDGRTCVIWVDAVEVSVDGGDLHE